MELAVINVDYPSVASVEVAQATADNALAQALAAPAEGAALAAIYFNEQMLPYSLVPLVPVGASISSAIGLVELTAASAQSTADNANTRIDNLTVNLIGDVIGSNNISDPVITVFKPNPVFTGNGSMTMPSGNNTQRPTTLIPGMIRFNTSL